MYASQAANFSFFLPAQAYYIIQLYQYKYLLPAWGGEREKQKKLFLMANNRNCRH